MTAHSAPPGDMLAGYDPSTGRFRPEELRLAQFRRKLTNQALAARAGVSLRTVEKARAGRCLRPESAWRIVEALQGVVAMEGVA